MTIPITEDIYWVGVNDRETQFFEELWPLPHGISYNAYLICDEKSALIDAVKKSFSGEFEAALRTLLKNGRKLDYLVINHIEPDHSGALGSLLRLYPDLCVVGNEKTLALLGEFYRFPVKTHLIRDGETLSLGKRTLEFVVTPMAHWPETMMTYERTSGVLFSGDVFGSFGALSGKIFDEEADLHFFEDEARRYFSNVLGKYCVPLQKAFDKIKGLNIRIVASTHGPVYRKDPGFIRDLYRRWSLHETRPGVVIVYASMYENTRRMAEAIARGLAEYGVKEVRVHDVSHAHISFILKDIWQFRGLVLASCTYNTRLFPMMDLLLTFLENHHVEKHLLGLLGSCSWANAALPVLRDFASKGKWQLMEPVIEARCSPSDEVLEQCARLSENMARMVGRS